MRLQDDRRNDIEAIGSLLIDTHEGTRIPLNQLAAIASSAGTAIMGLLPLLLLRLHGTEIERPLAVVMIGGLVTSTAFTLLALPTFYLETHRLFERRGLRPGVRRQG